jgi:hypothetical protein
MTDALINPQLQSSGCLLNMQTACSKYTRQGEQLDKGAYPSILENDVVSLVGSKGCESATQNLYHAHT